MYLLDSKLGRRVFLKGTGAVALGAAAGGGVTGCASVGPREHALDLNADGAAKWGREAGEWIPSCCNMCGGQCGIQPDRCRIDCLCQCQPEQPGG